MEWINYGLVICLKKKQERERVNEEMDAEKMRQGAANQTSCQADCQARPLMFLPAQSLAGKSAFARSSTPRGAVLKVGIGTLQAGGDSRPEMVGT